LLRLKGEREAIIAQAQAAKRPLTWHEQEELFRWYSTRVDKYLDAGHGDCWLARPEIADLVAGALRFHAGQRFDLHAWVVMPNHAHAVLRPQSAWTLSEILKSWKGFSAREANRLLKRTRDFAQVQGKTSIDREAADYALDRLRVDKRGLDEMDRRILLSIVEKFSGGPVGIQSLAVAVSEEQETIEDVYEPFLIQQGFLQRTPRGRIATPMALTHLGIAGAPQAEGDPGRLF